MVDNINSINSLGGMNHAARARRAYGAQKPQQAAKTDEVQVSSELKELSKMDGIRLDKVIEVRRAIENGTYLTAEKLDKALDGAIDEAFGEISK